MLATWSCSVCFSLHHPGVEFSSPPPFFVQWFQDNFLTILHYKFCFPPLFGNHKTATCDRTPF